MWQGLSETDADADDRDPAPGVRSEAPLADRRAAAAPAARPRVCARACTWGAGRAAAEGRREGGGGRPSPPVAAPGAAPLRAGDRRLPAAAATAATRWRDSRSAPRPPASAADSASCRPGRRFCRSPGLGSAEEGEMSAAASPAPERGWKSEKVDEAQALARSCAARRPDFQPCDGLSICATHSHGKCFKLHWCCHLGWCHCKSSRVSPLSAAVLGRPRGRPGSRLGLCSRGGSGLGRGGSAAGRGRPGLRAGGSCPHAGQLGLALPWQRGEIPRVA